MKILIVRFSSIGDVVLTTPVIRCLKTQMEDVELHYITKKQFASIINQNPYLDKVHTIEKSIDEILPELKKEKFDLLIDLHNNIRTLALKKKLGVKAYSFPKLNFRKWLLVNFKTNRMPKRHVVDRYFDAVKPLGVLPDKQSGDYFIPKEEIIDLSSFQLEVKNYVAIAIGAQFETKVLPSQKLIEIINKIEGQTVLLGGPTDIDKSNYIQKNADKEVINLCGKLTLNQSASLVAQSKVLLSHDTGLMHIASCFDVPIVSVWGNTVPALGMYPYLPQKENGFKIHEVPNLSCRPCSKIGYHECPKKHFNCMEFQDAKAISADVNYFMKENK